MSEVQDDPTLQDPPQPNPAPADPAATPEPTPSGPDTSWVPKRIVEVTAARRKAE